MSTFNGRLQNPLLNFIAIDDFTPNNHDASVFFLSHAHSDHLRGFWDHHESLFGSNSDKTLYCTHTTKRLIQIKYSNVSDDHIVSLEVGESSILYTPQKSDDKDETSSLITVTVLPTLHVLGSVMFLFECQDICALYTGDFRIDTGDVSKMKALHDSDGNPLKITDLYLDTTFADERHIWFPKRDSAIAKIIELSKEWLDESENNIVALTLVSYYGYESLIIDLSKALNTKILANEFAFPHFKYIPEMDKSIICFKYLTDAICSQSKRPKTDCNRSGRIHVCSKYKPCDICIGSDQLLRIIKPCALSFYLKPDDYTNIFQKFEKNSYKVAYSLHCSLTELQFFTNYLNPTNVYPSVAQHPDSCKQILDLLGIKSSETTCNDKNSIELSLTEHETDSESDRSTGISLDSPPF